MGAAAGGSQGIQWHQPYVLTAVGSGATLTVDPSNGIMQTLTGITADFVLDISVGDSSGHPMKLRIHCGASVKTITWGSNVSAGSSSYALTANKDTWFQFTYYNGLWELVATPLAI